MLGYFFILAGIGLILIYPVIESIERLTQGIYDMSDAQTQALADLVAGVSNAITAATSKISALVAANANIQPDDSAAIEAQVKTLNDFAASLNPPAAPAPAPAPVTQ